MNHLNLILTFCAVGKAVAVPSIALHTDFSKHSMNATKFLVHRKLFNSPSVCFTFVSSFNVNIESLAHDLIPPKMF